MKYYTEEPPVTSIAGCAETHAMGGPTGSLRLVTEEPQRKSLAPGGTTVDGKETPADLPIERTRLESPSPGKSLIPEFAANVSKGDLDTRALDDQLDGRCDIAIVAELQEALWLAQDQLAAEQRQRATERRQYEVFQDEYLRLQEESASNSRRYTVAEASAKTSRSLAATAIEEKEYLARLLQRTQAELYSITKFVEDVIPKFSRKICTLVEQGNTMVALLASIWPEARLRQHIDELALSDQPLAQRALRFSVGTGHPTTPPPQPVTATLHSNSPTRKASLNSTGARHTAIRAEARRNEGLLAVLQPKEIAGTGQQTKTANAAKERHNLEHNPRTNPAQGRLLSANDTTSCRSAATRPLQPPQLLSRQGTLPQHTEALASKTTLPGSVSIEKQMDSRAPFLGLSGHKNGTKLVPSRPPSVARPRLLQATTPRKTKTLDSNIYLTPSHARIPTVTLTVAKGVSHGPAAPSARDASQSSRSHVTTSRKDAQSEVSSFKKDSSAVTTLTAQRKASVRKARLPKEHSLQQRETHGHSARPASVRSASRASTKPTNVAVAHPSASQSVSVGWGLRATQPQPLPAALQIGSMPCRRSCGPVFSSGREQMRRRESLVEFLKDPEEEQFARRLFEDLSQLVAIDTDDVDPGIGQAAVSDTNVAHSQKKKLPPLPPSIKPLANASVNDAGHNADSAPSFTPMTKPLEAKRITNSPMGLKASKAPVNAPPPVSHAASTSSVQCEDLAAEQSEPIRSGTTDLVKGVVGGRHGQTVLAHKPAAVIRPSVVSVKGTQCTGIGTNLSEHKYSKESASALEGNIAGVPTAKPGSLIQANHVSTAQPSPPPLPTSIAPEVQRAQLRQTQLPTTGCSGTLRTAVRLVAPAGQNSGAVDQHRLPAGQAMTSSKWNNNVFCSVPGLQEEFTVSAKSQVGDNWKPIGSKIKRHNYSQNLTRAAASGILKSLVNP
ncbi:flocculation protein FLO11 [Cyclospora cayetanensis]|uniref:Flocculation protein FLO11 n=1 Tax=Cyclospora cayetanensis TaxID=88456 RepID=A0A6P6RZT1_9EIME|nr:flocculation protein FLO11 [Cyclospora cayetanensis]